MQGKKTTKVSTSGRGGHTFRPNVQRARNASVMITVPFAALVLYHSNIGLHRGRRWGFREVFGLPTLLNLPFLHLASRVKRAYDGKDVPSHAGWLAQREALQWLVEKGRDGIYAIDDKGIKIKSAPFRAYYIDDGHHRALALFVLGDGEVRARIIA